jgi:ribonucleoside-diphosphate reductase alpha chain
MPALTPPDRPMSEFARTIFETKYAHQKPSGHKETWPEVARRVVRSVCRDRIPEAQIERLETLVRDRKFMPGGRYLYASGRAYHQVNNCFLMRAHDSREGWADLLRRATNALMSGGGIGIDYTPIRPEGSLVKGLGGVCTGPLSLMQMVNEAGRHIRQGGSRRSAIWAGLHWRHPDVQKFIHLKDWPDWLAERKRVDFDTVAPMDSTNISVQLDDEFFQAQADPGHVRHSLANEVYWATLRHMLESAEPGFSVDVGSNAGETLRNACTELSSRDDDDVCNIGSLVLPRFRSREEFAEAVRDATTFLVLGSEYSDLPYPEVVPVRERNRRLGLGLMGFHEWLLRRGRRYDPDPELASWLSEYACSTALAHEVCDRLGLSRSVKTRALAPNGTIAIVAETTSSIEPIFATAFLRRYQAGDRWRAQYVIDAAAQRLIDDGVDPDAIEDAYSLAEQVERRVAFQAWVQAFVDHGISSTINLPAWGSSINNESTVRRFGEMLLRYLPQLRGVTAYPDGSRGGQPLNRVDYREAVRHLGHELDLSSEHVTLEEYTNETACPGGTCSA